MNLSHSLSSFLLLFLFLFISPSNSTTDYTSLVLKGCANQKFPDPQSIYIQNLNSLFTSLNSQSSLSKFFKSTAGDSQSAITGLFQCRGDLSIPDCNNCVNKLPQISLKLCGGDAIAVRIQLVGCYLRYEIAGFRQVSGTEFLHKVCKPEEGLVPSAVWTALGEIEKGMMMTGDGFYAGSYESVFVLGQCEGDLGNSDCVECVKNAVEKVKIECGNSISAQIYLQKCYISYTYYPNGVSPRTQSGTGQNTQKIVAIVFGGSACFGLTVACLLFLRSTFKKNQYYKY
ncbi:plasmodesmata-located protein 2 isoform X2 [Impatiens glandulifera]|uniref:plasmodesmata-located protein 2 isoform X2 n=1 Tax=Impatiens glandulifera TaxID=253017 RepID=UPI001FB06857|nr:plasmodesmata-located protein 2 isoform X2 [Impatiens glandulifera]